MIHVRLTHEELALLRRGVERTLRVAKAPGARTPQLGAPVEVYARAERENGELVRRRAALRCFVAAVDGADGHWTITYHAGVVQPPRFLRARPGMVRHKPDPRGGDPLTDGDADYTSSLAAAAPGEPECVPESWERQVAKVAGRPAPQGRRPWRSTA